MAMAGSDVFIPPEPDWQYWGRMHKAELWQAIMLSLRFDPEGFYPVDGKVGGIPIPAGKEFWPAPLSALHLMRPEDRSQIDDLFRIAGNHIGDSLPVVEENEF